MIRCHGGAQRAASRLRFVALLRHHLTILPYKSRSLFAAAPALALALAARVGFCHTALTCADVNVTARETDLYPAVKTFLEGQGYVVKSEVGAADVVAIRGGEPPVIVELKLGFSLTLVHQCVARLGVSDDVYMAVGSRQGESGSSNR